MQELSLHVSVPMKAFDFILGQCNDVTQRATVYYLWNALKNMLCQLRVIGIGKRIASGADLHALSHGRRAGSGSSEWI